MPEGDKSGTPAASAAPASPQLSEAELEAVVRRVIEAQIKGPGGLMSGFQKQVNDALAASRITTVNKDEKPLAQMTPEERALRVREEAVTAKEHEVTQRGLAVEYGVPIDKVTGATEVEMRLAATTYLLANPSKGTEGAKRLVNTPSPGGNPPTGGSELTPLQKIQEGLKERPLERRV